MEVVVVVVELVVVDDPLVELEVGAVELVVVTGVVVGVVFGTVLPEVGVVLEDPPVVVVDVDGEGFRVVRFDAGMLLERGRTPHGPLVPDRCGTLNGLDGFPEWVAPRLRITRAQAAAPPRITDPAATGRRTATRRSRASSLRLRCSSSGDS